MIGVKIKDRVSNNDIRNKTKVTDILTKIESQKWRQTGHSQTDKQYKWSKIGTHEMAKRTEIDPTVDRKTRLDKPRVPIGEELHKMGYSGDSQRRSLLKGDLKRATSYNYLIYFC